MTTIARHSPHVLCSRIYPTDHHRFLERAQQHCRLHRQRSLRHELLEQRVVLDAGCILSSIALNPVWAVTGKYRNWLGTESSKSRAIFPSMPAVTRRGSVPPRENPGDELNEAILTLDLAGAECPILTFQQFEGTLGGGHGDRNDALGESHVVLAGSVVRPAGALGDGLSVSNDGVHW